MKTQCGGDCDGHDKAGASVADRPTASVSEATVFMCFRSLSLPVSHGDGWDRTFFTSVPSTQHRAHNARHEIVYLFISVMTTQHDKCYNMRNLGVCRNTEERHHQTAHEGFLEKVRSELGLDRLVGAHQAKRA